MKIFSNAASMNILCKPKSVRLLFLGCITLLLLHQWDFTRRFYNHGTNSALKKDLKYILIWANPNYEPIKSWGRGQKELIKRKCKVSDCFVTPNMSLLSSVKEFDAIAFHAPEIRVGRDAPSPEVRSPHQKYVFVSMESSQYYPICNKTYDGYFNWSCTHRLDSDIPYGYINIRNINGDIIGPNKSMHWLKLNSMEQINNETIVHFGKKNKTAAWFVSNCRSLSRRESFVFTLQWELRKYNLKVDIFSDCFRTMNKCPRQKMPECLKMIQEEYYFYLALENSLSEDYVSEKILIALQNYAVPVVLGGANYTRFMPDGIYLNGGKLNPPALAKEMNDIIKDKDRYYSFFKWRNHYSYHRNHEADVLCRLCEMLHDPTLVENKTVYKNLREWWNPPEACFSQFNIEQVYMKNW